jgi:uncharacterized membrane protein
MDGNLVSLAAACTTFVGSHIVMSHPLRAPMVRVLGEKGFQAVYSLVSLAAFWWIATAFRASPAGGMPQTGMVGWGLASLLTLLAMILLVGSFRGNPALPQPGADKLAMAEPCGVFLVTRHPMMWAIALWAAAHMVLAWNARSLILPAAMLVLALAGARLQDRKKAKLMGASWQGWQGRTSFWPRLARLPDAGIINWVAGLAGWLAATWLHTVIGPVPSGIWN